MKIVTKRQKVDIGQRISGIIMVGCASFKHLAYVMSVAAKSANKIGATFRKIQIAQQKEL